MIVYNEKAIEDDNEVNVVQISAEYNCIMSKIFLIYYWVTQDFIGSPLEEHFC